MKALLIGIMFSVAITPLCRAASVGGDLESAGRKYPDEIIDDFAENAFRSEIGRLLRWEQDMNVSITGDNTYAFRSIVAKYISQFQPLVPFEISTDWDREANFVILISSDPSRDIASVYFEIWKSFFQSKEGLADGLANIRNMGRGCRLIFTYNDQWKVTKAFFTIDRSVQKSILHNCLYGQFLRAFGIANVKDIPTWELGSDYIKLTGSHRTMLNMLYEDKLISGLTPGEVKSVLRQLPK